MSLRRRTAPMGSSAGLQAVFGAKPAGRPSRYLLACNMPLAIPFPTRPQSKGVRGRRPSRRLAGAAVGVLEALALNGFGLCVWRWLFDLGFVTAFPFYQGVLSHWQTWFICGIVLQVMVSEVAKYARRSREPKPRGGMGTRSRLPRRRRSASGWPATRKRFASRV